MKIISEFIIFGTFLTAAVLLMVHAPIVLLAFGLVLVGMGVKRESN